MARDERKMYRSNGGNRFWSGLLLLAAGGLLMARKLGADIPEWLFNWYTILIAVGLLLVIHLRRKFKPISMVH